MTEISLEAVRERPGTIYLEPISRYSIYALERDKGFVWFPGCDGVPDGCKLEVFEL